MSTLKVSNIQSNSATAPPAIQNNAGTEYGTFCRAWINFNGVTPVINASFNVGSLVDDGTGRFSVVFTNAFPDANYAFAGSGGYRDGTDDANGFIVRPRRTTTITINASRCGLTICDSGNNFNSDPVIANVIFFR